MIVKIFSGICDVQGKLYEISFDELNATCREDEKEKFILGKMHCEYAENTGLCDGQKCSILEQNGIKR